jgi:large subunit ribosomal protein L35
MTKIKTHQGMKKRIKKTANGKLKRDRAYQSHLLEKKSQKKKHLFRNDHNIDKADRRKVKKLIVN